MTQPNRRTGASRRLSLGAFPPPLCPTPKTADIPAVCRLSSTNQKIK